MPPTLPHTTRLRLEDCDVDLERKVVIRQGAFQRLRRQEHELLAYLVANASRTVSKEELLQHVWGYAAGVKSRTVVSTVHRLRQKIEADPQLPRHLLSVYGEGYRFERLDQAPVSTQSGQQPLGNLPSAFSKLLGREADLAAVVDALSIHPIVTLRGVAGIGKSRLALEVARMHQAAYPGGTWRVLLEETADAVGAVIRVLGVQPGQDDPLVAVATALGARGPLLLWLDGCEGVTETLREASSHWVAGAPLLRILVTSRQALDHPAEQVLDLSPLDPEAARNLLLIRAREHQPAFGEGQEDAVASLVEALDGLPLALELAATRASLLDAASLRDRMDQRLRVLSDAAASGRHRSLAAALDDSWDLLSDAERRALGQTALFANGMDAAAAEAVLDLGDNYVLDALRRKSVLVIETGREGSRFRLLASVQTYASARHGSDPEATARHAAWYARLGDRAPNQWDDPIHEVLPEVDNVELAWERTRDPELRARLLVAMTRAAVPQGRLDHPLERARGLDAHTLPHDTAVRFLISRAELQNLVGGPVGRLPDLREALARARQSGDPVLRGQVVQALAEGLALGLGLHAEGLALIQESLLDLRDAAAPAVEAQLLHVLARIHLTAGDTLQAEMATQAALAAAERAGSQPNALVRLKALLAGVWDRAGRLDAAAALLREAVADARINRAVGPLQFALLMALHTEYNLGHIEAACALALELEDLSARRGAPSQVLRFRVERCGLLPLLGQIAEAEALTLAALGGAVSVQERLQAHHLLGQLYLHTDRLDQARAQLLAGAALAEHLGDRLHVAICRAQLALIGWIEDPDADPAGALTEAVEVLAGHIEVVELHGALAAVYAAGDQVDRARAEIEAAQVAAQVRSGMSALVEVWSGHVELALARQAKERGEVRVEQGWIGTARGRLEDSTEPGTPFRFARRLLRQQLDRSERRAQ